MQRFRAAEVLFQPSFIGKEADGIHQTLFKTVRSAAHKESCCEAPQSCFSPHLLRRS